MTFKTLFDKALCIMAAMQACLAAQDGSQATVTFDEAWSKVRQQSFLLQRKNLSTQALRGRVVQAGLRPNPVACLEVHNVWGNRSYHGFEAAEVTYGFSQIIEVGGKRRARQRAAAAEETASLWELALDELLLREETIKEVATLEALQRREDNARQRLKTAEEVLATTRQLVDEGKSPPTQIKRALVTLHQATLKLEEVSQQRQALRYSLAKLWGSPCPDFDYVAFPLEQVANPHPLDALQTMVGSSASLWSSQAVATAACRALQRERAYRFPDVEVEAGYRHFNDCNKHAWVFAVHVPIQLFDNNQGNICTAQYEWMRALVAQEETLQSDLAELGALHHQLQNSYQQVVIYRDGLLKETQETLSMIQQGYDEGKYSYLDILDAQQEVYDSIDSYLEALLQYHLYNASIHRITESYALCQKECAVS